MLNRTVDEKEVILIGNEIAIHVNKVRGRTVGVSVSAPKHLPIVFDRRASDEAKARRRNSRRETVGRATCAAAIAFAAILPGCSGNAEPTVAPEPSGIADLHRPVHRVDIGVDNGHVIAFQCCESCGDMPEVVRPSVDPRDLEFVPQPTLSSVLGR